jgi:hypothetical protein
MAQPLTPGFPQEFKYLGLPSSAILFVHKIFMIIRSQYHGHDYAKVYNGGWGHARYMCHLRFFSSVMLVCFRVHTLCFLLFPVVLWDEFVCLSPKWRKGF